MLKILLLTTFHPQPAMEIVEKIFHNMGGRVLPGSPLIIAQMAADQTESSFGATFYPALNIYETEKERIAVEQIEQGRDVFVTVGTDTVDSIHWYDVIIGYKEESHGDDWAILDEDFNIKEKKILTFNHAEFVFETFDEVKRFIARLIIAKERKDNAI